MISLDTFTSIVFDVEIFSTVISVTISDHKSEDDKCFSCGSTLSVCAETLIIKIDNANNIDCFILVRFATKIRTKSTVINKYQYRLNRFECVSIDTKFPNHQ